MKSVALLLTSASVLAACATTETAPAPQNTNQALKPAISDEDRFEGVKRNASYFDVRAAKWFAVEKLWPAEPYMTLAFSEDADPSVISFKCNTDTGALTGVLHRLKKTHLGEAATFTLKTDETQTDLRGMFTENKTTGDTEFSFRLDWPEMAAISNAKRTDFIGPDQGSVLAVIDDLTDTKSPTQILASKKNFNAIQRDLYYFCNPK